jgi:hypothetical protein
LNRFGVSAIVAGSATSDSSEANALNVGAFAIEPTGVAALAVALLLETWKLAEILPAPASPVVPWLLAIRDDRDLVCQRLQQ